MKRIYSSLFTLWLVLMLLHISTSCSNSSATDNDTSSAEETTATASKKITLGIIPLTDCAPLVIAHEKGFFKKYGLEVEISKEASWANVRDKILTGELDGAHCLFGMPFSVYTGVGGKAGSEMHIAMILNNNGQAITLSKDFCGDVPFQKTDGVAAAVEKMKTKKEPTFAMTFPGGTHDIWLRYWLAASGVDQNKVKIITIPPPQMVANMKVGNMDGFCVGEPWNQVAVKQGIGFTHVSSQDIWKNHPEKALVVNKEFSGTRREDMKKVMKAVLEGSMWLDDMKNRAEAAEIIGRPSYVNAPAKEIEARLMGNYDLGCDYGTHTYTDDYMLYHNKGMVNYPRKAHGIWYLNQYVRFNYLKQAPNYKEVADKLILQDVYAEVAKEMGIVLPEDDMQPFTIDLDKATFDPNNPDGGLAKK
ncbi:CmpA/NrtA family ABC transporter substrate-binding protein [Rhodocytophaga aerolata]|uniref:CmpA/NrtA family ABC transporter substrate-binding protein n=1 Tax=Rhodocytophaga aerolata TaxID=455078 RepID=A0ABT8R3R6_9BACT|nr:CmpA/NrtA family ABC transporter substrate-binding protein [Rhodocytophaga aerolata]MDO1446751.1 CmpA/NrtA family ABC transporter substrate-binding protein [Rhodocytophaga aerolata]